MLKIDDDLLERLGNYYVWLSEQGRISGITFERFLQMWELGTWKEVVA